MAAENNFNAYSSDYTQIADCLLAIQALDDSGKLNSHAKLLHSLRLLERDVLKKLYLITIKVLKVAISQESIDHSDGEVKTDAPVVPSLKYEDYFYGDFEGEDFLFDDFYVGFIDTIGRGYGAIFRSILNMLDKISSYPDISYTEEDRYALNEALEAVISAFKVIKALLIDLGLNPCTNYNQTYLNNTDGIYLQVAGSDGNIGVAEGFHLRWSFTGVLGDNHLAKGDYYNGQNGALSNFNRPDDYVRVFRTPSSGAVVSTLNLELNRPVINFQTSQWTYTINNMVNGAKISSRITITFENPDAYRQLAKTIDPRVNYYRFLNSYLEIISIEVEGKTSYQVGVFSKNTDTGRSFLKMQAYSKVAEDDENVIQTRKTIFHDNTDGQIGEITADNIVKVSVKKSPSVDLKYFSFAAYHDLLITRQDTDWTEVGNGFAISLNDNIVFDRLENPNYPIDHLWPHYNDGTTVRVANYQHKWLTSRPDSPSVKLVLEKYLQLSHTDPRAEEVINNVNTAQDNEGFTISYLDIINMQALDYHFARMLGLGHIDNEDGSYFYQVRYTNKNSLGSTGMSSYVYTSLPVSKTDYVLPEVPRMRPVAYQFLGDNDNMNELLDENGYAKFDYTRVVNIGRLPFSSELVDHNFFADLSAVENHNIFQYPKPVLYGLEYRAENQSRYVKPEITSSVAIGEHRYYAYDQTNTQGVLEAEPLRDDVLSLFTHFEREEGKHYYALYGINWFSRASALSQEVETDSTKFNAVNSLLPPSDVTVQYIQKEDPLLFTTTTEQYWLSGRKQTFAGQDTNFTRVTFNWLDILDATRLINQSAPQLNTLIKADHVKAYFNPELPLTITGQIKNVIQEPNSEKLIRLVIGSYNQIDGTVVKPDVSPDVFFKFKNSLLTTSNGKYRVENIVNGSAGAEIIVEFITESKVVDDENEPGAYSTQRFSSVPEIGSKFTLAENLSSPSNWEPIAEMVKLLSFADVNNPVIERTTDSEGKETTYWIGGIHNHAVVTPLFGSEYPEGLLGYYKVTFDINGILDEHTQINLPYDVNNPDKNSPEQLQKAHVEWYKGLIRIPTIKEDPEPKLLEVIRIEETHPLELYVYDPNYLEDPIKNSGHTELTVPVNFHPGYRVYFFPETGPGRVFNRTSIHPVGDNNDKRTQFGLQTIDSRLESNDNVSAISLPAILLSRKIEEPIQFGVPQTFGMKVRPDATGKAAFTFDVKIEPTINGIKRSPFGFMFYRTTNEDVLEALYEPATINQILNTINELHDDPFYNQRYLELVNLIFDPANSGFFKEFPATPNPYGFPVPDKVGLVNAEDNLLIKKQKYFGAIQSTLLPLTEQPPILNFIKQGLQTENAVPSIRDLEGNLLEASDPAFNPFPMIRQFSKPSQPNTTSIRFTDYSLSGASRRLYFFAGVEVTNQLEPGVLSPFTGPVTILHTLPSAAPIMTRFAIDLSSFSSQSGATVTFNIAPMSPEDRISKIRIYRSKDIDDTISLQNMDYHVDRDVIFNPLEDHVITDDFGDLSIAPLGDRLYYRMAGIRTIINENGEEEDVLSLATKVIAITLPAYLSPEAPELAYDQADNKLTWSSTATKAKYFVFKQNNRGNWERVSEAIESDSTSPMEYVLPSPLPAVDEDGDKLYYRYKIQVQNSSGLVNLTDKEYTIPSVPLG